MRKLLTLLLALAAVAYPLAVYAALGHVDPKWLSLVLVVLVVTRAAFARERFWWVVAIGASVLCAVGWMRSDALTVKLYPVLVNVVMLGTFAFSLWRPPSVVERLARLSEPGLSPSGVRYTERVTAVWCGFFVVNGSIALGTVLWGSDRTWALYNGLISYVFMGALMAGEWCVRQRVRAVVEGRAR